MSFNKNYASYYDAFYCDKDYRAECDFMEEIFKEYALQKIRNILDLGCGTGEHAIELAKRGYATTGIDASKSMIDIATKKYRNTGPKVNFLVSRMERFNLKCEFDSIICVFNAINHVITCEALEKVFSNVHKHLKNKGLFIFDFRNGITSLRSYSPTRIKWVDCNDKKVLRISESKLDAMKQLYYTTYTCFVFDKNRVVKQFQDKHIVRFLFPEEVRYFLKKSNLRVIRMCRFLALNAPAGENEWNIVVISRSA